MRNKWLAVTGLVIAALIVAACGSTTATHTAGTPTSKPTSPAPHAASSTEVRSATVHGTKVLTNSKGFTLYTFAPDSSTASKCNGACATAWPPQPGPATAGSGVTGKLGTITRSNGEKQASYDGRPLYTFTGDKSAGEATGNGVNAFGGLWHAATVAGTMMPASPKATHTTGGGGGY